MIKRTLVVVVSLFCCFLAGAQITPVKNMKISKTTKIKTGVYRIYAADNLEQPAILIEGSNITIDFNNATLVGNYLNRNPDEFFGVAILIRDSKNVTIKNLKAKGYKIALIARNSEQLTIENCDFSYNYRPHLNSTQEKEDVSDWMSYHHNEKDEWLRYGAAIYLRNCNFTTIRNCTVTGGQNALMMMECNDGKIHKNDFSFNSGIGIGMYRCNRNTVNFNRLIFNVRGYSHGVYNRGQDSAGILVYEQSNNNSFYYNNVTHGGDGFFLWAGQTTMDTGNGGCNNNIIFGNDFSYAPTNGIEVTFSSNYIAQNRIYECDHGIWGGYSFNTSIIGNHFRDNRVGIAIEHGQRNLIENNIFAGDKTALKLWSNKLEPSDWGYPKYRDTRSAAYNISVNSFHRNPVVLSLGRSDSIWFHENEIDGKIENNLKVDSTITNFDSLYNPFVTGSPVDPVLPVMPGKKPFEGTGKWKGRKNILITEWGPYDFRSPIIWNTNPNDTSDTMKFDLLGPAGKWTIKNYRGVNDISAMNGEFPASIIAKKIKGDRTDIFIELEYTGSSITTLFGAPIVAGKPYGFSFKKFFQPMDWEVLFYPLDTTSHNPVTTNTLFSPLEKKTPFKTERLNKIEYAWWGGIKHNGITHPQFITVATAKANLPKGEYELSVTWDDAARIYIDDVLVFDEWRPSRYKFDESPNRRIGLSISGEHNFRVEHLELGGFATLSLKLRKIE